MLPFLLTRVKWDFYKEHKPSNIVWLYENPVKQWVACSNLWIRHYGTVHVYVFYGWGLGVCGWMSRPPPSSNPPQCKLGCVFLLILTIYYIGIHVFSWMIIGEKTECTRGNWLFKDLVWQASLFFGKPSLIYDTDGLEATWYQISVVCLVSRSALQQCALMIFWDDVYYCVRKLQSLDSNVTPTALLLILLLL